jgi:hypothetical protein
MADETERYRAEMGREPPSSEHPLAWQWDWRGTKAEKDALLDELFGREPEQPAEVHPDQTDLFSEA